MKKIILIVFMFSYFSISNYIISQGNSDTNEVYTFVKIIIENLNLNKNFRLELNIEDNCFTLNCNDSITLEKMKIDSTNSYDVYTTFTKCLNRDDIEFIKNQVQNNELRNWDNKILNFNLNNSENYYSLSPPLFNKDRNIMLIKLEEFCNKPHCGQGKTLIFKNNGGIWESSIIEQWFY